MTSEIYYLTIVSWFLAVSCLQSLEPFDHREQSLILVTSSKKGITIRIHITIRATGILKDPRNSQG